MILKSKPRTLIIVSAMALTAALMLLSAIGCGNSAGEEGNVNDQLDSQAIVEVGGGT